MLVRLTALAVFLALACAGAARAQEPDAQALIDAAVQAHAEHRYEEAHARLVEALAIHPTARVLRALGMCEVELGQLTEAYRTLARALAEEGPDGALSTEQRAHVEELVGRVASQIARVRVGETNATIDGEAGAPAVDGWVPLRPGAHRVELATAGATVRVEILVHAGDARALEELVELRPIEDEPDILQQTTRVAIVDDPQLPEPPPHRDLLSSFVASASGTIGGHDGGNGWYAAAGFVASLGALTRFSDDVSVGGTLSIAWSRLLDDGNASQTRTWFGVGLRLSVEIHPMHTPVAVLVSLGGYVGTRARPDDGTLQRPDVGLELEVGPRFFVVDEILFLGADLRVVTGGLNGADVGLVLGVRTP